MKNIFCSITEAIKEIKKGKMLIMVDDPHRENEGDFFCPTDTITPKKLTQMIRFGGGLICTAITKKQAAQLSLPLMVESSKNTENTKVSFAVSVNAKEGITTGISAFDRYRTIRILGDPNSQDVDLVKPGHVFPLVADDGGVIERGGHTEAAADLARLAGFQPSGVLCEILRDDGRMARLSNLIKLAKKFKIKIISIDDLKTYLKKHPLSRVEFPSVVKTAQAFLPTDYGNFQISVYVSLIDRREHTVLTLGDIKKGPILTRIHSQCLTGDTFFSLKCDCRKQLHQSMKKIREKGRGIIIYLNQEGRGIGLSNKIKAYSLQEKGLDTVEANHALGLPSDTRDYKIAAEILTDLGISQIILLTNNPQKIEELSKNGIKIAKRLSLEISPNNLNYSYLLTKKNKLGHKLTIV